MERAKELGIDVSAYYDEDAPGPIRDPDDGGSNGDIDRNSYEDTDTLIYNPFDNDAGVLNKNRIKTYDVRFITRRPPAINQLIAFPISLTIRTMQFISR